MISSVAHIFFLIAFIYLSINVLYLLVFAIAGLLINSKEYPPQRQKKKFAILIPTYKEDEVIVRTVQEAATHDYPQECFDVFVAADQLREETVEQLRALRATVHVVQFETGSKARSLNFLLNAIREDQYDLAMILDGDNLMLPGCLEKANAAFQNGFRAVQCHRMAKNKNNPLARLDALSEEINNHLFRQGQRSLGFSASTIGSGMAFEFSKLKQVYNKPGILGNPACDREVDFEMMKAGIVVEYLQHACVLDEKVAVQKVFQNQRTRWLESQLIHLGLFFSRREKPVLKTKDYWNKLFINLAPPRMIFLAILSLLVLWSVTEHLLQIRVTGIPLVWWGCLWSILVLSLILSVPRQFYSRQTALAILYLPVAMFSFLKAAIRVNTHRKEFVHTPKSFTGEVNSPDNSK